MRRLAYMLLLFVTCAFTSVAAQTQNRSAELDKAVEEARSANLALQEAQKRRDAGVESEPGERTGSAAGGSRPNEQYIGRQAMLEHEVELARRRYEAAAKRWNDLK